MIVDCAVYEDGLRRAGELALEQAYEAGRKAGAFVWIGLHEPTAAEFESVRSEFNLHELAVEDAIHAHQRPKLEVYGDSLFVVLKPARYDDDREAVDLGEIMLFIGEGFVVTVRHGDTPALAEVRRQVQGRPDRLRCGPGAVLHAVLDRVVDDYTAVVEGLDGDLQELEEQVFSPVKHNPAERIYKLMRQVLLFHRATASLLEPLERLARGQVPLVDPGLGEFFRDVHDHLLRVTSSVEAFRDLLTGALQANLAQVGVRQNEDMRKISAWVAILAVQTAIAGIYGMNFEHMPEFEWVAGYPLTLGLILVVSVILYRAFRRSGWL
ncbi:MAG: magnesium/cobalt transporter CorA [Actinomycetota bacterium]|nr:magnesium/cobalt transporter CorA [Actinomycetota bacterium]